MAIKTLLNKLNPLTWNVALVDKNGNPTEEFQRKWEQQRKFNATVPDLTDAAAVSKLLDVIGLDQGDLLYRDSAQWKVLGPGTTGFILKTNGPSANPAWESISTALDVLGAVQGDILYRNGTTWTVLAPGTDGQTLQYDGTTHAPKWATASAGGVILGSGAPASVQPAGTLYSRTDVAGVYSSQPTLAAPAIVQHAKQDNNIAGNPFGIIFGSALTTGNLAVAVLFEGGLTVPPAATGWTLGGSFNDGLNCYTAVYYRTVQAGDGTTPPNIVSSGAGNSSGWVCWEISGASWTLDGALVGAGVLAGATTTVMSSFTPSTAGDLILTSVSEFKTLGAAPSVGSPFTADDTLLCFRGTDWFGHDSNPPAATPIAATITWDAGYTNAVYIIIPIKGSGLVANWVQIGGSGVYVQLSGDTMTGALRHPNGTAAAPSDAFSTGNSGWWWDGTNLNLSIAGVKVMAFGAGGITASIPGGGTVTLDVQGEGNTNQACERYDSSNTPPTINMRKARGTIAAPTVVATNDSIGRVQFQPYTGAAFPNCIQINGIMIDTTPGPTALGGRLTFAMPAIGSATVTECVRVEVGTGLSMFGANKVIDQNRLLIKRSFAVASLPAAPPTGACALATDSTLSLSAGLGNIVAGGGGNVTPVWYNGANWIIG